MTTKLSRDTIAPFILAADAGYKARTLPAMQNLAKNGMQEDCARALETLDSITPAQWAHLETLKLGDDAVAGLERIARATNTKVPLRAAGLLAFLAGGAVPPASARTFCLAVGAVLAADCKTRDGLQWAVTRKGNENTSDGINVAVAGKLQKIGITSPASFDTQFSVSFSPDGLGSVFGLGIKGKKNEMPTINGNAPFARAIMSRLAALTEIEVRDLEEKVNKGKGKGNGKGKGK